MTTQILKLLAQFGNNIEHSPDLVPAFGNYFQDAGVGASLIGNITIVNGERLYPIGDTSEHPAFTFEWYNDGLFMTDKHHPTVADIVRNDYDGVVSIKVVVTHLPTSTIYQRTEWAFFDMLGVSPTLEGNGRPLRWEVFYNFYEYWNDNGDLVPFAPHHFARLEMDKDGDGLVDTADLLDVISSTPAVALKAGTFIDVDDKQKYSDAEWQWLPSVYKWLTTDENGEVFAHSFLPGKCSDGWASKDNSHEKIKPYAGDWEESVEARPKHLR